MDIDSQIKWGFRVLFGWILFMWLLMILGLVCMFFGPEHPDDVRKRNLEHLQIKYYKLKINEMLDEHDEQEGCCYDSPLPHVFNDKVWRNAVNDALEAD